MEKTIEQDRYNIKIMLDTTPESPREWDNIGTMICWHNRYDLGDEHDYSDSRDFFGSLTNLSDEEIYDLPEQDLMDEASKNNIIIPLYLYDHSGITMKTKPFSDRWDSGQVGYIYCSKDKAKAEYGKDEAEAFEKARNFMLQEIKTYDQYLRGDVYGYEVEKDGKQIDSCWGFYGSNHKDSGLLDTAQDIINNERERDRAKHFHRLKGWIRNQVPLIYRTPCTA